MYNQKLIGTNFQNWLGQCNILASYQVYDFWLTVFWGKGIVMWGVFVLTDWIGIKVSGMIVSDRKSTIIVNFQARHSINLTIDSKTERIMKNDSYSIATLLIQFAQSFCWRREKILKQTGFLNWIYTFRNSANLKYVFVS